MVDVPFGSWRPDPYTIDTQFSPEIKNCLPSSAGWKPFPGIASITDAVAEVPRGAFVARSSTGSAVIFVGTATKLYKLSGTSWTDVTRSSGGNYSLPTDEYWSFDQQDNLLYACQAGDVPQVINVDSGTNFAALAGSPPTARYVRAVGNFIFLLDLTSAVGASGASSGRIQAAWSGFRDFDHWTFGEKSADSWTGFSGGHVMGMTTKQTGLLFQEKAVNRFQRLADRRVWGFSKIESAQGTKSPHSIIEHQGVAYYYGTDGFVASSAGAFTQESGTEWVDEWFKSEANTTRAKTILGALDPTRPRLFWLFPSAGNDSYVLDRLIGYDIPTRQWFHAELSASYVFTAATSGTTLENLGSASLGYTLENVPYSLDSDVWKGGAPQTGLFGSDKKLGYLTGNNLEATLRTARVQLIPRRRAFVQGIEPLCDTANVEGRVGVMERPQGTVSWGAKNTLTTEGMIPVRSSGRFHQIECSIPAGENWTDIRGVGFGDEGLREDGGR